MGKNHNEKKPKQNPNRQKQPSESMNTEATQAYDNVKKGKPSDLF